jgi:hypothetical protein
MEPGGVGSSTSLPSWIATDGLGYWSVWHLEPSLHLVRRVTVEHSELQLPWMGGGAASTFGTEATSRPGWLRRCQQCELLWDLLLLLPPPLVNGNGAPKASSEP